MLALKATSNRSPTSGMVPTPTSSRTLAIILAATAGGTR